MAHVSFAAALSVFASLAPGAGDAPPPAAAPRAIVDGAVRVQAERKASPDAARFADFGDRVEAPDRLLVFLHLAASPTPALLASLRALGVEFGEDVAYVPPVGRHPRGYLIADAPVAALDAIARLPEIALVRSGERRIDPHALLLNDVAGGAGPLGINADTLQSMGFDGSGIRVAILDSSLDVAHPDFPAPVAVKDYSAFPALDDVVTSTVSGHGTHVTGSVLGRGTASGGLYEGQAPGADLVFLKIGNDSNASATEAAMAAAVRAAVDLYDADVVTASYGGFGIYNDGSEEIEQAADYAFSQGAIVFFSAGNSAQLAIHHSGTVAAGATSPFIQANVGSTGGTTLYFTLVWADGIGTTDDLDIRFYDGSQTEITSGIVLVEHPESARGTECDEAYYSVSVPGPSTYYVRVTNNSANSRFYHAFSFGFRVTFAAPDSSYTVGIPSIADEAISVAAYTSRDSFVNWCGSTSGFGQTLGNVASWSSRGPRIGDDGEKPSLAAPGTAVISALDSDAPYSSSLWIADDGVNDCNGPAQYCALQGTSMACPTAAGSAALLLSAFPALRGQPAVTRDLLVRTSDNGGAWANSDGYGYMDVLDAYNDAALAADVDAGGFPVTQVAPAAFVAHADVTVEGIRVESGLLAADFAATVGGAAATVSGAVYDGGLLQWELTIVPPALPVGSHDVAIEATVGGRATPPDTVADGYVVRDPVRVLSIAPDRGQTFGGESLTIGGTGFTPDTAVTIGGLPAPGVVFLNDSTLAATAPAHAIGLADVTVTNSFGADTLADGYEYFEPVGVASVSPESGPTIGGTSITVSGAGFVGGSTVTVDGVAATDVVLLDSETIVAVVPPGVAGPADVTVANGNGTDTLADGFEYFDPVAVASVDPACGPIDGGTPFTVTGAGFVAGSTVVLGGVSATDVVVVNGSTITALSPAHAAGFADVTVTNGNGSGTLPQGFEFLGPEVTCLYGTVNAGAGPVADVLRVNGGAGDSKRREVTLAIGEPFTMTIDAPPAETVAPYALYVWLGAPSAATPRPQPFGIGCTAMPTPLQRPDAPQPAVIFNNIGKRAQLGNPDYPSSPAPATVIDKADGIGRALAFTVQGFVIDHGSAGSKPASVTNGVIVRVE